MNAGRSSPSVLGRSNLAAVIARRGGPAHLHIDLLPRLQGQGVGKALMDRFLATVGGQAHLGCQAPNLRAQRFYDRYGFRRLDGIPPKSVVWMAIG